MALTQVSTNGIKDATIATADIADDAVTLAKMAGGTDGQIITYDASGNPVAVGPGTDGQVLTSTGAGSPPAFEDAASGVGGATGVDFNDSVKTRFGTGNDLEIYHDGNNSYIYDTGTGSLILRSSRVSFNDASNNEWGRFDSDGLRVVDSKKFRAGTDDDLQIYHDGTNSRFDNSTGYLTLRSNNFALQSGAGDHDYIMVPTSEQGVQLFYDNSKKFETTSTGIDVTNQIYFNGDTDTHISNAGNTANFLRFTSGGTAVFDVNDAQNVHIFDDRQLLIGSGSDLKIYHSSSANLSYITSSTNNVSHRFAAANTWTLETTAADKRIHCPGSGTSTSVELYYNGTKKLETTSSGATVIGELQIGDTSNHTKELRLADATRVDASSIKVDNSSNSDLLITNDRGSGAIRLATNSAERARVNSDGQFLLGSTANYGTIGTAAAFQIQGTNTGGNVSMNIINAATSNASSTCDINAWQDYRLSTRIISGRENASNWTSSSSAAASYLAFYTNSAGTVAERARIRSAGGITFNGDSAAANALDDYEEGSWTPTLRTNGDTTGQVTGTGTYVKIGRQVHIHVLFGNKTLTSLPTGDIAVVNMPFAASHGSGDEFAMSTNMVVMGVDSNSTHGYFRSADGSSSLLGYFNQDGSVWGQWSTTQWNNSGVYLIFNMTYFTNS